MIQIPKRLGCAEDPIDERDLEFIAGAVPEGMLTFQEGFSNQRKYGQLIRDDQYKAYSCVGEGSSNDTEMSVLITTGKTVHLSAVDIYSQIYIPGSGGANPRDAYKLLHKVGVCETTYLPRPDKLTEALARQSGILTTERSQNAYHFRIGAYRSIKTYDPEVFAQAIFLNGGVGGGYRPTQGGMGHFIFIEGYGLRDYSGLKLHGLKFLDSYPPYDKWLVLHNGHWYLDSPKGKEVYLYSHWTAEPNPLWTKQMEVFRKKGHDEVLAIINGTPYWFTGEDDFNNFAKEKMVDWQMVQEVDDFPIPYGGKIIGSPRVVDVVRKYVNRQQ